MYQPGLDNHLAQIRYAEVLEEAARDRADRKSQPAPKSSTRRLALALAAVAPVAAIVAWLLVAH